MVLGFLWSKSGYGKPVAENSEKSEINVKPHDTEQSGVENSDAESPPDYRMSFDDCWYLISSLGAACLGMYFTFRTRDKRVEMWEDVNWVIEQKWANTGPTLQKARKHLNDDLVLIAIYLFFNIGFLKAAIKDLRLAYRGIDKNRGRLSIKIAEIIILIIISAVLLASLGLDVVELIVTWKDRASILSMGTGNFEYRYEGLKISTSAPLIESKPWWKFMI